MSPSSRDPFNSRETTKGNEGSMVFELLNRPEGRVAVTFEDRSIQTSRTDDNRIVSPNTHRATLKFGYSSR